MERRSVEALIDDEKMEEKIIVATVAHVQHTYTCFTSPNSTSLRETIAKHPQLHQLSFTKNVKLAPTSRNP
jgi:hypothetical protein